MYWRFLGGGLEESSSVIWSKYIVYIMSFSKNKDSQS